MAERGKVLGAAAKRWVGGELPTAEYYATVYAEERELAAVQVDRALEARRRQRVAAQANQH